MFWLVIFSHFRIFVIDSTQYVYYMGVMSKNKNLNKRFEMKVSEEWAETVDNWRAGIKGLPPRAEAIRDLTMIGVSVHPILSQILEIASDRMDSSDPNEAAKAARIRSIVKTLL